MHFHRLSQTRWVVAAFQEADDASFGILISDCEDGGCELAKVFRFQPQRSNWVLAVSIEAGANQHELGLDLRGQIDQPLLKRSRELGDRRAIFHGDVNDMAQTRARADFVRVARSWIERPAVNRQKADPAVLPE